MLPFFVACLLACANPVVSLSPVAQEIAVANDIVANEIYQELSSEPGNRLICPISLQSVMGMTFLGAKEQTALEFTDVLRFPEDKRSTGIGFELLIKKFIAASKGVTLKLANKIYISNYVRLAEKYKKDAMKRFRSEIESVDFVQSVQTAQQINSWVEQNTDNKIRGLVDPSMMSGNTVMMLINAAFFEGKWKKPFSVLTHPLSFKTGLMAIDLPHLYIEDKFNYFEDPSRRFKSVEIPYEDEDFSLIIVVPEDGGALSALEKEMPLNLDGKLKSQSVHVHIPKFKIESKMDMKSALKKMGLQNPFERSADFSDMGVGNIFISDVIQKNYINVDEFGTQAASASSVGIVPLSASFDRPIIFMADKPFLFMLRKKSTETTLFMGRFSAPLK